MVIVLPSKPDGLPAIEKQLTAENLTKWLAGVQEFEDVQVSLPPIRQLA